MYETIRKPAIIIDASVPDAKKFLYAKASPESKRRIMEISKKFREDRQKLRGNKNN